MKRVRAWMLTGVAGLSVCGVARSQEVTLLPPTDPVQFSAPAPGKGAKGMSLNEFIATVMTSDPKLRVGYEEINQAIAEQITASLRPNPTFSTDAQLLPIGRPITPVQQGGPPQFDAIFSFPVDWWLFGKRKAAMASATVGIRKTEAEYYDLLRTRIREAALAYFEALELKAIRDVAQIDVENLTKVETIIDRAVKNGGRPAVDLSRIRLDLLRSQQVLRDAEAGARNAKTKLRAMLGRNDDDPNFDVDGSLDLPPLSPPMSVDTAVAIAQENRPDLTALRLKVAKAEADVDIARRKGYPDVAIRSGYSRQFQSSIGYRDMDTYLVGVDMSLPIFDRNQGGRSNAASLLAQSQFELQSGLVELRSEIEQSLTDFRFALLSAQAVAQEQLKLAEQVRDAINKANEVGGQPLLNVLDAQRNFRETYRLYITSRANYWRASVRLNATLGKKVVP